jgi:uncharacterized protein YndB with AHSA1/START domain
MTTVRGRFKDVQATLTGDRDHPELAGVEARMATASIDTGVPDRDAHLRGPDFFDAEQHPEITFRFLRLEGIPPNTEGDRAHRAHDAADHRHEGGRGMSVTAVRKDPRAHTLRIEAEFEATPARVWQLWADPRQLERWWGPPTYPATVDAHDLRPGGRVAYHMTGPEGDQPRGYWEVLEVEPPHRLSFRDGFANDDGTPNTALPMTDARVTIEDLGHGRTRMAVQSTFASAEAMERMLAMGMEEGMKQALGQIDAILAEDSLSAGC